MEVVDDLSRCTPPAGGAVVTVGAYDGVHLGHQRLIALVRELADERALASAVVTFDRHPALVVRPESAPRLLTDLRTKLELLADTGIGQALVVPFDEARSKEPAEEFVRAVLVGCMGARVIVVGHDFHFGHNREGNVALLDRLGAELGYAVVGVGLFDDSERGDPVSSTRVRSALAMGDVDTATSLLGRPHRVRGMVAHGDARGRALGFPTANVVVPAEICIPADGIYAGWYRRPGGGRLPAALSVGRRPTFYDDAPTSLLEAHVMDFECDLYGEEAVIEFVARLREERRFDTTETLVRQIEADVGAARAVLAVV